MRRWLPLLCFAAFAVAACGGDDSTKKTPTPQAGGEDLSAIKT